MAPEPTPVVWVPGDGAEPSLGAAAGAAGRADLVVLMPGVEPFGDWLERLLAAARSDTTIATASAMLSDGPWAPEPLPRSADALARTAALVAADAGRLRPRIAEPIAGCVLLRRSALDAAGCGSGDDASPAAALAAFGERCTAMGLGHVLADDVLAAGAPAALHADEAQALDARHPHRPAARALDARPESPVSHAVLVAGHNLDTLSVTIDGRVLGPSRAGTQVHALELIAALGRTGRVRLRVLTQPDLDPHARRVLDAIEDLTLLPHAAVEGAPPTDIVHRPSQVFSPPDLAVLPHLGHRLVVTHQDLIGYRIPGYHESAETWERYRRTTEATLSAADHVVFFSEHARRDALADNLVEPSSTSVVPIGVDHHVAGPGEEEDARPPALPAGDAPFLLCLGAGLRHKNHGFALELVAALRAGDGWDGRLVFAGPTGSTGGAPPAGEDAERVVRLGPVPEAHKRWLLHHAAAVVYPSLYEGFGLIPFEAGAAGTPCLFAAQSALAEVLPASTATIVAWDAAATAPAVAPLLREGPQRAAHVAALREAAAAYRWDDTAQALVDLYERLVVMPPRELRRAARERLTFERRLTDCETARFEEWHRFEAFRADIGDDGLGLVGPDGVLDRDEQRALLALLSRRALRRPAMGAALAAYRLAMRLGRRGREPTN